MKDENDNKPKQKKGDTLDFYNESLPRKAVESLFGKSDDELSVGRGTGRAGSEKDRGDVRFQEKLGYKDKSSSEGDNLEDNIALYSKSNTQKTRKDYYTGPVSSKRPVFSDSAAAGYEQSREREKQPDEAPKGSYAEARRHSDEAPQRASRAERVSGENENEEVSAHYQRHAPMDDLPRRARESEQKSQRHQEDIERRRAESEYRRKAGYQSSALKERKSGARLFDPDDYASDAALPIRVIIASVAAAAVLLIFIGLIIKINSLNAALSKVDTDDAALLAVKEELTDALIEIDKLKSEVEYQKNLVETYKNITSPSSGANSDDSDGAQSPAPNPVTQPPAGASGGSQTPPASNGGEQGQIKTHTVVSGETLSKIAQKYYNNASLYPKIKEANNLKSDNLTVGQQLVIP